MPIFVNVNNGYGQPTIEPPSFVGAVLKTWVRVDSLFEADHYMARVWNGKEAKDYTIGGRQWGMGGCSDTVSPQRAEVDATDEVKAAHEAWLALKTQELNTINMYWDAHRLEPGKTVKVISGRKIPIGTVGKVSRIGKSGYGEWAIVDGTLTNVTNLEVIPDMSWWE